MVPLLIASMVFAVLTLILLIAFFATGAKNHRLRYLAGATGLVAGLLWLIKTFMR